MKVDIDTSDKLYADAWLGFKGTDWKNEINVRDFIQHNYTPYEGDESFLAEATPATTELWEKVMEGIRIENATHAPVDFDTNIATTITAHDAGYINQPLEKIVGLQTDAPLKRALHPFGGINMIKSSFHAYGREMDSEFEYLFTDLRKTHNQGVFDVYSPDMLRCRKSGVLTGLPDGYGRGRIIGDYRRVALYGISYLVRERELQFADLQSRLEKGEDLEATIRLREELAEHRHALLQIQEMAAGKVSVKIQEPCNEILFSRAKVWNGEKWACVTIVGGHTNIVHIETHNGVVFTQQACVAEGEQESPLTVLSRTTLAEILKFVNEVPFAAIRFILDSAKLNCALSQEGLSGKWGLHIGATLEKQCERGLLAKDLSSSIVIRTSAASDARMGGATLPAMSNSGSGNQGITATMPVVVVAEHFGADDERLARALMLSHLSAIYIHNQLPRLSALCAATTAAMGAAAGMAWLVDGRYETISMAISSMIGDVSGMICDGASNSCAMKVSTSASAAWKAVLMALDDTAVTGNEGIVAHDVEQSIANLCALASHSMQQTDRQIIEIMASKAR
ncbi:L-serine ammonia-lyase, iron-sulfur-dependent, subunit alpha [Escherichia coli]|nr:L-serine ammonia-lyase, iron-sulfur-dependent, subunit alpha [Escherichia coli]